LFARWIPFLGGTRSDSKKRVAPNNDQKKDNLNADHFQDQEKEQIKGKC
jgi:hypothetical protein